MTEFTPLTSTIGGALIGLAAVLLMALQGRIAGISGIGAALLPPWMTADRSDFGWRIAFVAGLLLAPLIIVLVTGSPVVQTVSGNLPLMVVAGALTGFGSIFGNGCTSGHGVCGLSRLSTRSFVATGTFMLVAALTVYVTRHMGG